MLKNAMLWFFLLVFSISGQILLFNEHLVMYQEDSSPGSPGEKLLECCGSGILVRGGFCIHVNVYTVIKHMVVASVILIPVIVLCKIFIFDWKEPTPTELAPIRRRIRRNQRQRERMRENEREMQRQRDWMKAVKVFLTWTFASAWEMFDTKADRYFYDDTVELSSFDRYPPEDYLGNEPPAPPLPALTFIASVPPKRRKRSKQHRPRAN